jgi:Fic family protein
MASTQTVSLENNLDTFQPSIDIRALLRLRFLAGEFDHRIGGGRTREDASADIKRFIHALALAEVRSLDALDLEGIQELHAALLGQATPSQWRRTSVAVRFNRPGSRLWLTGATPTEILPRLREMQNSICRNSALGRFERIALLHLELLRTHPFEDGNGRLARILLSALIKREFASGVYLGLARIMRGDFVRYNAAIRSQRDDAYGRWIRYCSGALTAELHAAQRFDDALRRLQAADQTAAMEMVAKLTHRLEGGETIPRTKHLRANEGVLNLLRGVLDRP